MSGPSSLNGVIQIGNSLVSDQLETNFVCFFDWAFLGVGAFFNINYNQTAPYGGDQSRLRLSEDPQYPLGAVWEGFRGNWVFESGIQYSTQPIQISGVLVNNSFHSITETGVFSHYIDYTRGRIIFNNPISPQSIVQCAYSFKYVNFSTADVPWFRELMFGSLRPDDSRFLQYGSGQWSISPDKRIQLPAVVVEAVPQRTHAGLELGGGSIYQQDIIYHVFTENAFDRKQITDAIDYQFYKTINGFDKNVVNSNNAWALDYRGMIVPSGALMYPNLSDPNGPYMWRKITVLRSRLQQQDTSLPLFASIVRQTVEVYSPEIG